jgi:hypothetical protein
VLETGPGPRYAADRLENLTRLIHRDITRAEADSVFGRTECSQEIRRGQNARLTVVPPDPDPNDGGSSRRVSAALPRVGPPDLRFFAIDQAFRTGRTLLRGAIGLGWAYFEYLIAHDLAGQNTSVLVDFAIKAIVDTRFVIATGAMGALGGWALTERALRKRQIVRWHVRIKELESKLDVNRTTSTLTVRGDTNPRDRGL